MAGRAGAGAAIGRRRASRENLRQRQSEAADNPPACKNVRRAIGVEAFHRDRVILPCRFQEGPEFVGALQTDTLGRDSLPAFDFTQRSSSAWVMLPSTIRRSQRRRVWRIAPDASFPGLGPAVMLTVVDSGPLLHNLVNRPRDATHSGRLS